MNNITLFGRMTDDAVISTTGTGLKVANFTIAVDRPFTKKESNDDKPTADFFKVVAWRQCAEFLEKYSAKGFRILVSGRLQNRTWEDEDGDPHYVTEVIANDVRIMDYKEDTKSSKPAGKKYRK